VVTVWFVAVAGVGLAARRRRASVRPSLGRYPRVAVALAVLVMGVTPVVVAVSQRRLNTAVAALERGQCGQAIHSALGSITAIDARPEPFEVLGYCDSQLGRSRLAERAFRAAIKRDPDNWETYYGLALARAAAGRNPASPVRIARRLNPHGSLPRRAASRLLRAGPRRWRAYARRAPPALP
jgi:Tfp pilus assembly protein PilF